MTHKPKLSPLLYVTMIFIWMAMEYTAYVGRVQGMYNRIAFATCAMILGGMVIYDTALYIAMLWTRLAPMRSPAKTAPVRAPRKLITGTHLTRGVVTHQSVVVEGSVLRIRVDMQEGHSIGGRYFEYRFACAYGMDDRIRFQKMSDALTIDEICQWAQRDALRNAECLLFNCLDHAKAIRVYAIAQQITDTL